MGQVEAGFPLHTHPEHTLATPVRPKRGTNVIELSGGPQTP